MSKEPVRVPVEVTDDEGLLDANATKMAEELAETICLRPCFQALSDDPEGWFRLSSSEAAEHSTGDAADALRQQDHFFDLRVMDSPKLATEVGAILDEADPDDEWPVQKWAERAVARGGSVVVVAVPRTSMYGGMVAFRRAVYIQAGDGTKLSIDYILDLSSVYVIPSARGSRLTAALRLSIWHVFFGDVTVLADLLQSGTLKRFGNPTMEFRLLGEAHSKGGMQFLDSVADEMDDAILTMFSEQNLVADVAGEVSREYGY